MIKNEEDCAERADFPGKGHAEQQGMVVVLAACVEIVIEGGCGELDHAGGGCQG